MKKLLSLLLALALLLSLFGCRPAGDPNQWTQLPETTAATEATTVPETTEATEPSAEATEPSVVATEPVQTQPDDRDEPTYPTQPDDRDDRYEDTYPTQPDDREEEDTRPRPTEPEVTEPSAEPTEPSTEAPTESQYPIDPNGHYTSRDDVALYIHVFGCLPNNYISKYQGNLQYGSYKNIPYSMNIGGDVFQNREGLLPRGCTYFECDIDTAGGRNRGTRRIVFSSDGAVYYTSDHYGSFIQLY